MRKQHALSPGIHFTTPTGRCRNALLPAYPLTVTGTSVFPGIGLESASEVVRGS